MAHVKHGDTVRVHYIGKLADGTIFDSSSEHDPLQFIIGQRQLIPGFEDAVVGMQPGESKTTVIASDHAYGAYQEDMIVTVNRESIPAHIDLQLDQQLQIMQEDGAMFLVQVTEISDEMVTLDANHPLAGQDLTFDIELVEIMPLDTSTEM